MPHRYFLLEGNQASAPMAEMWIEPLQAMIDEDGDGMEVFQSDIPTRWIYAVHIWTHEGNFTDDVKKDIVPQMLGPQLGPSWQEVQEVQASAFHSACAKIEWLRREEAWKDQERKAAYNALVAAKIENAKPARHYGGYGVSAIERDPR